MYLNSSSSNQQLIDFSKSFLELACRIYHYRTTNRKPSIILGLRQHPKFSNLYSNHFLQPHSTCIECVLDYMTWLRLVQSVVALNLLPCVTRALCRSHKVARQVKGCYFHVKIRRKYIKVCHRIKPIKHMDFTICFLI